MQRAGLMGKDFKAVALTSMIFGSAVGFPDAGANESNLKVEVNRNFPTEIHFRSLKQTVVDLLTPCHPEDTAGGWDEELIGTLQRVRLELVDTLLEHTVDEEYIPVRREPKPDAYSSRTVFVDPLARGTSYYSLEGLPQGFSVEVDLKDELTFRINKSGGPAKETAYNVDIWDWRGANRDRGKHCSFTAHY